MRICYVLLSPTLGMHQYTAHIAGRMAQGGHDVHVLTTSSAPLDLYAPALSVHPQVTTTNTGLSVEALRIRSLWRVGEAVTGIGPNVVHFTGPHVWNIPLLLHLAGRQICVVHTLHDLSPHYGTRFRKLLLLWNRIVIRSAHHILVHGEIYRKQLVEGGLPSGKVSCTPLLCLPFGFAVANSLMSGADVPIRYEPWALFFGRFEAYKGIEHLLEACGVDFGRPGEVRLVLAGLGDFAARWPHALPEGVELRNRVIPDQEAVDLLRRCGLLVMPYVDASQSALVAAAHYFRKPVLATRSGALPEYVEDGVSGRIVEPGCPEALGRCLGEMLADPVRLARMGSAGRSWYDARRAAETRALFSMYEDAAKRAGVGAAGAEAPPA